jgi:hypothetical protein
MFRLIFWIQRIKKNSIFLKKGIKYIGQCPIYNTSKTITFNHPNLIGDANGRADPIGKGTKLGREADSNSRRNILW